MFLKGKAEAFAAFRDVLAEELGGAGVLRQGDVRAVLEGRVGGGGVKEEEGGGEGGGDGDGDGGVKMEEEGGGGGVKMEEGGGAANG